MNNWQDIDSCFGSPERGALDPLRRPGRDDLLRHGQAGARAADRAGAAAVKAQRNGFLTGGNEDNRDNCLNENSVFLCLLLLES